MECVHQGSEQACTVFQQLQVLQLGAGQPEEIAQEVTSGFDTSRLQVQTALADFAQLAADKLGVGVGEVYPLDHPLDG